MESLELPAANPGYSAIHLDPSTYYCIPERVIYRNYPVYAPGQRRSRGSFALPLDDFDPFDCGRDARDREYFARRESPDYLAAGISREDSVSQFFDFFLDPGI